MTDENVTVAPFSTSAVFVGDDVSGLVSSQGDAQAMRFNMGLLEVAGSGIEASVSGILTFPRPGESAVLLRSSAYLPKKGDVVVGVVEKSFGMNYIVGVNAGCRAVLPALAFSGATKRNRPNLKPGTVVYARVVLCVDNTEVVLSCVDDTGMKKDWVTGESLYGELKGGYAFSCSRSMARRLMEPNCPILKEVAKYAAFEIVVGVNGNVWVQADTPETMFCIETVIKRCEAMM